MKKLPIRLPITIRKNKLPVSLRTQQDELKYLRVKKTKTTKHLLDEPRLKEWKLWALIHNEYPYSAAFKTHHLLIPKRVASDKDLTAAEKTELNNILGELGDSYDCLLVNFKSKQSIRSHFHVHLLIYKDKRRQLKI